MGEAEKIRPLGVGVVSGEGYNRHDALRKISSVLLSKTINGL